MRSLTRASGLVLLLVLASVGSPRAEARESLLGARLYRGMNERQIPLSRIRAVLRGESGVYVPSHRFTSLKNGAGQALFDAAVAARIDADLQFWRERGELREWAFCHADPYECMMPSAATLRAVSMTDSAGWRLPEGLLSIFLPDAERFAPRDYSQKQRLLRYFDPVISATPSIEVARSFARGDVDASGRGYIGFVLELTDSAGRHCPLERQREGRCFVQTDEYGEEREYPFFGYIRSDEIVAVEVQGVRFVRRHAP